MLSKITGKSLQYEESNEETAENCIYIGAAPFARAPLARALSNEEFIIKTFGTKLFIVGGQPRGTMYGVYHLLQDTCGVRWWTPWATTIPSNPNLTIPTLDKRQKPAFESRDPYWHHAINGEWARHNYSNSQFADLDLAHGGRITYQGFVHTFYGLVPPSLFSEHPDWFSLINGKRTTANAQLCTTNPELREYILEQVKKLLKEHPDINILSVSQNDCFNPCQCDQCQALVKQEGSEAGPMIALANYIGENIEKDYPNVAIDTLAYQYTRHAPKTFRPRPNVIVRLCSIECNFAKPLLDPSNQAFSADIQAWGQLTNRLYIWDYVTDFPHYIQPFPNYAVLGPNLRFFAANGVKGVFEEGAYESCGAEMAELRAWLLAQLMWNPNQDDQKLTAEFLDGYYGAAGKPIRQYLDLMSDAAKGTYMTIWADANAPFFDYPTMLKAERLWQSAEAAVKGDPELLQRVRIGHLPVRTIWLTRWQDFRRQSKKRSDTWPLDISRKKVADEWYAVATATGPEGWTSITHISEGGPGPQAFTSQFATDPPEPIVYKLPSRPSRTAPPTDIPLGSGATYVIAQDDLANLWKDGEGSELRPDPAASDGIACWMPGSHYEWAFQIPFDRLPKSVQSGRWKVYVVARVEEDGTSKATDLAFSAGVYDNGGKREVLHRQVQFREVTNAYRSYELGDIDGSPNDSIWVAPPANPSVKSLWVDRVVFVKQ